MSPCWTQNLNSWLFSGNPVLYYSSCIAVHGTEKVLRVCGGLKRNGPHVHMCLNAWAIGSVTVRRCCFVSVGVALMEEVCHYGGEL